MNQDDAGGVEVSPTIFGRIAPDLLARLMEHGEVVSIGSGEALVHQREQADSFFFVLQGHFLVVSGERPIAEIVSGEPIGEIAFFAGSTRTASVIASRRSRVLKISREAYSAVSKQVPEVADAIIASLAARVSQASRAMPSFLPKAGRIVGVVAAGEIGRDADITAALIGAVEAASGWKCLGEGDLPADADRDEMLMRAEMDGRGLVLLSDARSSAEWSEFVADSADSLFVLADAASGERAPSALERKAWRQRPAANLHLVLVRDNSGTAIRDTAAWLAERPALTHHHVARGEAAGIARLVRFMTGEARGIVFSGGGAFGAGHLGMLKALMERGFTFDMLGGTSMGSAVAGAMAMGLDPAEVMDICDDLFVRNKAMGRYTVPLYSVIEHRQFDALLRQHFRDRMIEDCPLGFFAVATSLTSNTMAVLRTGELWKAVRASASIPGILPPMVSDEGEVFIDGALVDNAPIETMRSLKPGPNVLLNIYRAPEWRAKSRYEDLPGRMGLLAGMVGLRRGRFRFPTALSILSRTMVVNADRKIDETEQKDDVFISVKPPHGTGFLNWKQARRHFQSSYETTTKALDATSPGMSEMAVLRHLASSLA
jgi:NTE family protein